VTVNMFTITITCSRSKKTITLFSLNRAKVEEVLNLLVPPIVIEEGTHAAAIGKTRLGIEQFIEEIRK
jgi:hypothetical protein